MSCYLFAVPNISLVFCILSYFSYNYLKIRTYFLNFIILCMRSSICIVSLLLILSYIVDFNKFMWIYALKLVNKWMKQNRCIFFMLLLIYLFLSDNKLTNKCVDKHKYLFLSCLYESFNINALNSATDPKLLMCRWVFLFFTFSYP